LPSKGTANTVLLVHISEGLSMTSLSVEAFCTIPTNLFPNKGVSLTFLQSFVNLPAMNTPMIQLLYPKMEPEVLEKMDLISLRSLAKELRVHSSLNGTDEFAMYDDETILREDWISAVNAPPTTTTHVNICIVKPATLLKHGSYADTIISNGSNPEWVNTPTDFISHAWRYNFKDLVNAIKNEADERDRNLILRGELPITNQRYYWNDIFVEDQNATLSKPDGYFFHSFRTAIITIGRTILILMPLKKAIPLTRAWCVWEMFCSIAAENVELCIALPPSERIVLEEMLMNEFEEIINIMTNVQIEKSQAFLTEDQNEIHRIVNEQCTNGYNGVNTIICNGLRNWLIETSELLLQRQGDGGIDNKIGAEGVNSGVEGDGDAKGKVDCKLQFQEGEESEKRLELMNQIGKMLHEQNRYVKAETLYREVLHRRQLLLGNDHIDTLASMNNLIKLLLDLNKNLNEVEILLHESLEIEEIKYGLIHSATLITITSLGTFSLHQDNLDAAERYFRRALRGWELINKTEGNGDNEDDLNILTSGESVLHQNSF
jgi:hypothetical protein